MHWARKPATVVYGRQGVERIADYNPPPLGVDPVKLAELLNRLASSEAAGALVLSARLYAQALRQLEHEVDLAYQSLVSCVETIANQALSEYLPPDSEMIAIQRSIIEKAINFGLEQDKAEAIAIEACSGMSWISRKFTKFLVDNAGDSIWEKDDLFHPLEFLLPKRGELERVIRSVYQARSGSTHAGRAYPGTASVGFGGTLPRSVLLDIDILDPEAKVPPAVWFERLVYLAITNFIGSSGTAPGRP